MARPAASESLVAPQVLGPMESAPVSEWSILVADKTLYYTLGRWAKQAGWQLVWEVDRNFVIDAQYVIRSPDLSGAVRVMFEALKESDYPLQAVINEEFKVLRVVRYMDGRVN